MLPHPRVWLTLLALAAFVLTAGCYSPFSNAADDDDSAVMADDDDSGQAPDDDDDDDDDTGAELSDSDEDTISDQDEGNADIDGDGIPNLEDEDSDGDGLSDRDEAGDGDPGTPPVDSDGDGVPDYLDQDSDANGVPDAQEGHTDTDGDGLVDAIDPDNDGDGIDDSDEVGDTPGAPLDSDSDGIPDFMDLDSDGDGINDDVEGTDDPDGDGIPSYRDDDADGDNVPDRDELGPDPASPMDSDSDGIPNFLDSDSDNDGIPDRDEPGYAGYSTSRIDRDTDNDGFTDLAEILAGSDPTVADDHTTWQEDYGFYAELPPRTTTTLSVPFTPEILRADVLFLLDTTCSMQDVLTTMATNFSDVVSGVTIPDVAFGVAEFDDYVYAGLGWWQVSNGLQMTYPNDKPFRLSQQVTTNTAMVGAALSSLGIRDGGDLPESAMEGLYQAASGRGYDLDCDLVYDAQTDVHPFHAIPSGPGMDAFHGNEPGVYDAGVPGTGYIGGAGFREGALPILVYTTDTYMRDADQPANYSLPPLCGDPAGASDVVLAASDIGAKLIGIGVEGTAGNSTSPIGQMTSLANQTGSLADIDSNGTLEPLVFQGTSLSTVDNVIDGVEALANSAVFDVSLSVDDSPFGFVTSISPSVATGVSVGTTVTFELTLLTSVPQTQSDQVFVFPMQVLGNGSSVLAEWQLVLVVLAG